MHSRIPQNSILKSRHFFFCSIKLIPPCSLACGIFRQKKKQLEADGPTRCGKPLLPDCVAPPRPPRPPISTFRPPAPGSNLPGSQTEPAFRRCFGDARSSERVTRGSNGGREPARRRVVGRQGGSRLLPHGPAQRKVWRER